MKITEAIALHFYEVNYGGNWTDANVKDSLTGISWQQARLSPGGANSIAVLLYHMQFYNDVISDRLKGEKKDASHESSFEVSINNEGDWLAIQENYFRSADNLHQQMLSLDEQYLFKKIAHSDSTIYKSLHGVIEHIHYHLGQINLLKKLAASTA